MPCKGTVRVVVNDVELDRALSQSGLLAARFEAAEKQLKEDGFNGCTRRETHAACLGRREWVFVGREN